MRTDLDEKLDAWRGRTSQVDLGSLEPRVWAAIVGARAPQGVDLLSIRAALVGAIMIAGFAAGVASGAATPAETSPFSVHSPYAPSTLLEGRP